MAYQFGYFLHSKKSSDTLTMSHNGQYKHSLWALQFIQHVYDVVYSNLCRCDGNYQLVVYNKGRLILILWVVSTGDPSSSYGCLSEMTVRSQIMYSRPTSELPRITMVDRSSGAAREDQSTSQRSPPAHLMYFP